MTAISNFNIFFNHFKTGRLWNNMENTHENSPWHREYSVAVHTQMLIDWYLSNLADKRSEKQQIYTLISCLFHDVGKPPSEIIKHSEARGEYRAYHGHELLSARMWSNYALINKQMLNDLFNFTIVDIANIAFMVEYHVPFDIKDEKKRLSLRQTLFYRLGIDGHQAWIDFLLSDQHGRNSDDQKQKLEHVDEWLRIWLEQCSHDEILV